MGRRKELRFHTKPNGRPRSWWQQIRHPKSGLGPGLRSRFFANAPQAFYYLPERLRLLLVRRSLGPSGGWFSRDMVVGKVPTLARTHSGARSESIRAGPSSSSRGRWRPTRDRSRTRDRRNGLQGANGPADVSEQGYSFVHQSN